MNGWILAFKTVMSISISIKKFGKISIVKGCPISRSFLNAYQKIKEFCILQSKQTGHLKLHSVNIFSNIIFD
jgi:hypothetical protein